MTRKYFGTDGIRGTANAAPMTADIALRVGMAAGCLFRRGSHRHRVVIGKDTRLSGYMLEPALTAGFAATGMDTILLGPMPTPAVAMLTRSLRADLGVMISASHNPFQDNGIKLFGPDGYKLSDAVELEIEAAMEDASQVDLASSKKLGRVRKLEDARGRYTEFVKHTFPKGLTLSGLKIVIDCANGAAYKVAPDVLWELGAEVIPMGVSPDGFNINDGCGSTSTEAMRVAVVKNKADLGIALDGDADRVIICDHDGRVLDGDQIMGTIAADWHKTGRLKGGALVATVMSNMGLEKFLQGHGLDLARTKVGDRYVVEHMRAHGQNLGGEQSGHIIFGDHATTGDGLLAALQVLAVVVQEQRTLGEVCRVFEPFPQLLKNVRYANGSDPLANKTVKEAIEAGENQLGDSGRVLIRKSGTEPLIRVMAEAEDPAMVTTVVNEIVSAVEQAVAS
ncbi:MAG: phosphoglucosamine mutase [Magnetospiraceae bacterium]